MKRATRKSPHNRLSGPTLTVAVLLALAGFALSGATACGSKALPVVAATPAAPGVPGPHGGTDTVPTAAPESVASNGDAWGILEEPPIDYGSVVDAVANMPNDASVVRGVTRRGLSVVNVTWEDTGRAEGSSLGPNISDLTLQVRRHEHGSRCGGRRADCFVEALMPVIRFPNFSDRTGDVPADKFFVRVGNEKGGELRTVPLGDVLKNLRAFASVPGGIFGSGDLTAPRDSHYLVSAQAVFLPIPKTGKAEFNPALFNYQSSPGSSAVLTILVTREGSSIRVIENRDEDATSNGSGQEIYFNNKGQKSAFTAERKSDVEHRIAAQGGPKTEADRSALAKGADVLVLVQVPLMHSHRGLLGGAMPAPSSGGAWSKSAMSPPAQAELADAERDPRSDVEQAVLGHGPNLGPYHEGNSQRLQRDPKFPVRITVQFYKATSNGVVSEADLDAIAKSIGSVYEHAAFVGSLVVPEGDRRRPTSWQSMPREWFPW